MFRIVATARAAVQASLNFGRARPWLIVIGLAGYVVAAAIGDLVLPRYHLGGWVGAYLTSSVGGLPGLVLLSPVWTALYRFVILRDRSRQYYPFDMRVRRVLGVSFVLAVVMMVGGLPYEFVHDANVALQGRRLAVMAAMLGAGGWKLACWWLACRLAIAPPLAAAGARKQALDTSFAYTDGAAIRIMLLKTLIYLPAFAILGVVMLIGSSSMVRVDLLSQPAGIALVVLVTAITETVDAAAMALVATSLVRARASAGG